MCVCEGGGGDKFHFLKLSAKRNNLYWFSKSNPLKCNIHDITHVEAAELLKRFSAFVEVEGS